MIEKTTQGRSVTYRFTAGGQAAQAAILGCLHYGMRLAGQRGIDGVSPGWTPEFVLQTFGMSGRTGR